MRHQLLRAMAPVFTGVFALAANPASAQTVYTDRTSFDAFSTTSLEDFNGAPSSSTATSVTFGALTFSCTASTYCPGFFGTRSGGNGGTSSVFFASPSDAIFTFSAPITAFGVDILGVGTVGGTDFSASINGTSYLLQDDYTSGLPFFFGYTGPSFTSITFSGSRPDDGIDFDDAAFGTASVNGAVPEPSTWAVMLLGFGFVGGAMRARRRQKATVSYA